MNSGIVRKGIAVWIGATIALVCVATASAGTPPSTSRSSSDASQQTRPHWDQVKTLIQRGAFRDALQELEIIHAINPEDARVSAYRALCEQRLRERTQFPPLEPEARRALEQSLQEEERARVRAKAQERALERQVEVEQRRWDEELKRLQREATQAEKAKRHQEQLESRRQRWTSRANPRERPPSRSVVSKPPAPAASGHPASSSVPATASSSEPTSQPSPLSSAEKQTHPSEPSAATPGPPSVMLEPVKVSTVTAPPSATESTGPAASPPPSEPMMPTALPPGSPQAVQMFADQMHVSPERQLAMADGNVRVFFQGGRLSCDHFTLFTDTKDLYAQGHVRLERGGEVFRGDMVHFNLQNKKGRILSGTAFVSPWYEQGQVIEHLAEGVLRVKSGSLTSCEFDPPHFRLQGREAIVFANDKIARSRNVTMRVEELPLWYFPMLTVADRQTPFFIIPGKRKPWEEFALMGYRYEWPEGQRGTLRLDWRRAFGWGTGLDHRFESAQYGNGLIKLYYNEEQNIRRPKTDLPKGAKQNRYRAMFRHYWRVMPDTTVITDLQKFSDIDFRKELLFREEFVNDDIPESYVSMVTSDPNYTIKLLMRKRLNRFQTVTEAYPEAAIDVHDQRIGLTQFYTSTSAGVANYQTKIAHSEIDTDAVRIDWSQQFSYAMSLLRPIQITPRIGVRQSYYNKDKQGGIERPDGRRHLISGQLFGGADASLKLFRVMPITTNWLGLDINWLRHVVTPTLAYKYIRPPTVPNGNLSFPASQAPLDQLTIGLENKLQTKRNINGLVQSVDLARFLTSLPYTFRNQVNKQGGRYGDTTFDLELYPWQWLRLETDWGYPSHFVPGSRDSRITSWNVDLVMVGGGSEPYAQAAPHIQAPARREFHQGRQPYGVPLLPQGQWYLGVGHRYSYNDKTEEVIQFDWRLSDRWQIGTFHRLTLKEVANGSKRFNNLREIQYVLTRDLHDWVGELVYRVDRELGEELFFTLTLKAYPLMPIELQDSYHQPKYGSQSSPFSPLRLQQPP